MWYGQQVHGLQVALNNCGYYCGEDDTVWWQFGGDTYSSLLTFQVSFIIERLRTLQVQCMYNL